MNDASEKTTPQTASQTSARKWPLALAVLLAMGLALLIFFLARNAQDPTPSMPEPTIDIAQRDAALKRLQQRAGQHQDDDYSRALTEAYFALNAAETQQPAAPPERIAELMNAFQERGLVPSTGQTDRFFRVGDSLAVAFEQALHRVLALAKTQGLSAVIQANGPEIQGLYKLSGSFFAHFLRRGIVAEDGTLSVDGAVPQILFRRRWRVLGGTAHRQDFLEIESLIDLNFVLHHTAPTQSALRLAAIRRIQGIDTNFDAELARALVLHEAGRIEEAHAIAAALQQARPQDRSIARYAAHLKKHPAPSPSVAPAGQK